MRARARLAQGLLHLDRCFITCIAKEGEADRGGGGGEQSAEIHPSNCVVDVNLKDLCFKLPVLLF